MAKEPIADVAAGAAVATAPEKKVEKRTSRPAADQSISKLFPYTQAPGTLKRALDGIITAQKPSRFTLDFLGDVLKVTGGSATAIIPILKRIGFLNSDGTPTDLYARFRADSSRPAAMLAGLRQGYQEAFRRREYAHRLKDNEFTDLVVEITGLQKTNPIFRAIVGTWKTLSEYVGDLVDANDVEESEETRQERAQPATEPVAASTPLPLGLAYQINIVLPETTNSEVFDAIFRSLKSHLLR